MLIRETANHKKVSLMEHRSKGRTSRLRGLIVQQPLQLYFHIDAFLCPCRDQRSQTDSEQTEQTAAERQRPSTRLVSTQQTWCEAISGPQTVCVLRGSSNFTLSGLRTEAEHIYNVMLQSPRSYLFSLFLFQ